MHTASVVRRYQPSVTGGGGHPGCFAATLLGGVNVWVKPVDPAQPTTTRAVHCEVAAWETIKLLGWTDMMGATVLRAFVSPITNSSTMASAQVVWHDLEVA